MAPEGHGSAISFTFDTDIGSDVDDLLALAVILGSPELEVSAVTTVYGDVELRARMVARTFAEAGRAAPAITPGRRSPRSGREVWWAGHEGSTMADLDSQRYSASPDAAAELAGRARCVAVGPLTNLAEALERPGHRIRELVLMGGAFDGRTEHNIRSDADAARVVFDSGVGITTVSVDQTERVRFSAGALQGLRGALGRMIEAEVRGYWTFAGHEGNTPHDPVAVVMLTSPQLFRFERGRITVDTSGPDIGMTRFTPDPAGPHRIVADLDVAAVERQIEDRIRAACIDGLEQAPISAPSP